jgi:hypothetical protein
MEGYTFQDRGAQGMGYYRTATGDTAAAAAVADGGGFAEGLAEAGGSGGRGRGRGRGGSGRGGGRGRGKKAAAAAAAGGDDADTDGDDTAAAAAAAEDSDGCVWGPFDDPAEEDECDLEAVQGSADVAEACSEVLLPLLPFQKQFLAWGIKQVSGLVGSVLWGGAGCQV